MKWNNHSRDVPEGAHAFLSGSRYSWINWNESHLIESYNNFLAVKRGTELHKFASDCIRLKQRLPDIKSTLTMYVNDAIELKMSSEVPLYYSKYAFGTADAISFENYILRIHDLKTGKTKASMHQLEIYAAYFCLEYDIRPSDAVIELRIYQNDDVIIAKPGVETIAPIMDKVVTFDRIISELRGDFEYD